MKVWPIITLVGLVYGSFYADGRNVGRESNPHPHAHRSVIDAELAEDMKAFDQPHRPVTVAYREFFAKLLQDGGVETVDPQTGKAATTAEADASADDGEDPAKKLFWHTVWPDAGDPAPFPGWGYADPDHSPIAPPACGQCRPHAEEITYYYYDDPPAPHEEFNAAVDAGSHAIMGNLPFGALQTEINLVKGGDGDVKITPCVVGLIDGSCVVPCTAITAALPSCSTTGTGDPVITTPLGGLPVTPSDPIVAGGGSGSGVGGGFGGGGVVAAGSVPETSTWLMLIAGFSLMGWLYHRKRLY